SVAFAFRKYIRRGSALANVIAGEEDVALNVFVLGDTHGIALAKFGGVRRRRRREQQAKTGKHHRQRGSPPDVFSEGKRDRTCQNSESENLKQREHGLPSFPKCPLKDQ